MGLCGMTVGKHCSAQLLRLGLSARKRSGFRAFASRTLTHEADGSRLGGSIAVGPMPRPSSEAESGTSNAGRRSTANVHVFDTFQAVGGSQAARQLALPARACSDCPYP